MSLEIMRDPRVRSVEWRDLTRLSRWEVARELLLSLPWLFLSLYFASRHWYIPALAASFILFLVGLRQSHNAQHRRDGSFAGSQDRPQQQHFHIAPDAGAKQRSEGEK